MIDYKRQQGIQRYQKAMFAELDGIYRAHPGVINESQMKWIRTFYNVCKEKGMLSKKQSDIIRDIRDKVKSRI